MYHKIKQGVKFINYMKQSRQDDFRIKIGLGGEKNLYTKNNPMSYCHRNNDTSTANNLTIIGAGMLQLFCLLGCTLESEHIR